MSSILKSLRVVMPALACIVFLLVLAGCARHRAMPMSDERPMSESMEIQAARVAVPPENPGDHVITSAPPTTGRYVETQPTGYTPTRIIVRVGDHGVARRAWPLMTTPRASGDTLAGPTYWPTIDDAVRRPNKVNVWLEPLEFLYNLALLPYRAIETPPWSKVVYSPSGGIDWSNVEQSSGVIFQERNQ